MVWNWHANDRDVCRTVGMSLTSDVILLLLQLEIMLVWFSSVHLHKRITACVLIFRKEIAASIQFESPFVLRKLILWKSAFWSRHIDHCLKFYCKQIAIYMSKQTCRYICMPCGSCELAIHLTHLLQLCNSNHALNLPWFFAFPENFESCKHFFRGVAIV